MSSLLPSVRGQYFEEFEAGQRIVSPGRTISESDIINFAGLTGDYTQIHTDVEFSKNTPYGQRIAHGLLGLSIAMGLATRTGMLEGTVLAFREILEWKFVKPIFIGDTVHVEIEVKETKGMPRVGGGLITIAAEVKNQRDETTMKGLWTALVVGKPKA